MVEIGKAKEGSYVLYFSGGQPGSNAIELDRVHGELTRFHNHSEVFDFGDVELTLFEFQVEVELSHALEDATSLFSVGLGVRGGDKEVVHIDDEPSFGNHVSEQVVHELLERGGGVAKAKEHDRRFKESFACDEGHLPLIAIFDADIVVSPTDIELGEVASVFQLVHEVGN